ncbi:MAG: hypothetical protein ACK53Y_27095, partial [bacterium]
MELVINQMNALAREYEEEMLHPGIQIPEQQSAKEEKEIENLEENLEELPEATFKTGETGDDRSGMEVEYDRTEDVIEDPEVTTRSGRAIQQPSRVLAVTKVSRWAGGEVACEQAIKAELSQLFD